jgi:NADH-quinone oxidoreductase subunit C
MTSVEPDRWSSTFEQARADGFEVFDWLAAVDLSGREPGVLEVVAQVIAPPGDQPMRLLTVRTRVPDGTALPSLTSVYAGAAWHEREAHEMLGLEFSGFDDGTGLGMRRLLLSDRAPATPGRASVYLAPRVETPWPGAADPADVGRRRNLPPGAPDPATGDQR